MGSEERETQEEGRLTQGGFSSWITVGHGTPFHQDSGNQVECAPQTCSCERQMNMYPLSLSPIGQGLPPGTDASLLPG